MRGLIVFAASLAQRPNAGGHARAFLQYLLGFRRLGWDILFLDRLEPGMCVDASGQPCPFEESENLRYLRQVMRDFGLEDAYSLGYASDERRFGLSRREVLDRVRRSALLINVMGFLGDEEILDAAPRRVFLDIDPGFGQMWRELGQCDIFHGHDAFVTVGANIGREGCTIPTCGIDWLTTLPPVVLEHWPVSEESGGDCTSVVTWRGPFAPVTYKGETYGLRVHSFRQLAGVPRASRQKFRLALDIHPAEVNDLALLRDSGWTLEDPASVAGDPGSYRDYLVRSGMEFMVAKDMYVRSRSGWFSDRSVCYLASGRPVVAQDTGFSRNLPTGSGLVAFDTPEEAAEGVRAVASDYRRHSRAARALACEFFDSDRVLRRLLDKLKVA